MRLDPAIQEFILWRRAQAFAANTVRNDRVHLGIARHVLGDIELELIGHAEMMRVFDHAARTRTASSVNILAGGLSAFFKWARMRKYMGPDNDPMIGIRARKVAKKERARIPLHDFNVFLDAATDPRDRALCALSLYLFTRASETTSLRVRDLDLTDGTVNVTVYKTGDFDIMPVSRELDREMRAWLMEYARICGPLDPNWYLVPARQQTGFHKHTLNPAAPISRPQETANTVLDAYGIKVKGESIHCLRRSGARALFDELSGSGVDRSLEIVSAMLHHASVTMTEKYLGITHSRAKRDGLIKGEDMFPSLAAENVVPIRKVG